MLAPKTLDRYVPALVGRDLAAKPTFNIEPTPQPLPAAVLLVNISGLTALAEYLAQQGAAGSDESIYLLKTHFKKLSDHFTQHGGDIIKLSGEALLGLWPTEFAGEDLATVTLRAAQCGLAIQTSLHNQPLLDNLNLSLKVSVTAGEVVTTHLGGVYGRWEFLATGQPIVQTSAIQSQIQPGQVVLSSEAWALVQDKCAAQSLTAGWMSLESVNAPLTPQSLALPALTRQAEAALRGYIPGALLSVMSTMQSSLMAELLPVTVLLINLPHLDYTVSFEQTQQVIRVLQTALYDHEGSVDKISIDQKGTSLIAVLGLPPMGHEDDALLGVQAALAMQAELQDLNMQADIGVTTGRAFCGVVGNDQRSEYTIIGHVITLAKTLTQAANAEPQAFPEIAGASVPILCDEATYQATKHQVTFNTLSPISMSGQSQQIAVYSPASGVENRE